MGVTSHVSVQCFFSLTVGMLTGWDNKKQKCILDFDLMQIHPRHLFSDDSLRGTEESSQRLESLPQVQFLFIL